MRCLLVIAIGLASAIGITKVPDMSITVAQAEDFAPEDSGSSVDRPVGTGADVTVLSKKKLFHLKQPELSMYVIDYSPGGTAILHRFPTGGYILVHVLSGAIRAQAWNAA